MKKRLVESLEVTMVADPNGSILIDNACSEWGSVPVPQLSVLVVHLRYLAMIHQTHHWTAKGDPFYGDHIMFGEMYSKTQDEIDAVAEKAVSFGTTSNVDLTLQTTQLMRLVQGYGMSQTIPQSTELAKRSLMAEINFIKTLNVLVCAMKENGTLTNGMENLLGGIEDTHEGHVYKLKQRCLPGM
jgi:DNA-binding ferritin-like protein